jgi:uncharacterized Tic20 family protein
MHFWVKAKLQPVSNPSISRSDIRLATWAGTLYLLNLLIIPGLAFLILIYLYYKHRDHNSTFVQNHLRQNLLAMIISGIAIVGVSIAILLLGGFDSPWTWMVLVLYGVSIHATLVLLGVLSVVKSGNGEPYHYPLLGRFSK